MSYPGRLTRRLAITHDGRVVALDVAKRQLAVEHHEAWGSATLESVKRMMRAKPDTEFAGLAWFDPRRVNTERLERDFAELGLAPRVVERPPLVLFRSRLATIKTIAHHPAIKKLVVEMPHESALAAVPDTPYQHDIQAPPYIPSSAFTTSSDLFFNDLGYTAKGVKIGFVELPGREAGACKIRDSHEAFSGTGAPTYMFPTPIGCTSNSDCSSPCPDGFGGNSTSVCNAGDCISLHGTAVVSRAVSGQGSGGPDYPAGKFHAGEAEIYIANNFTAGGLSGIDPTETEIFEAYQWLVNEKGVHIINESWGPTTSGRTIRTILSDWYAREESVLFVRASGNIPSGEDGTDTTVFCKDFNGLCVGATSKTAGSGRDPRAQRLYQSSRWGNPPHPFMSGTLLEQEKPDLVAEGAGQPLYALPDSDTSWGFSREGTSLAAPVVAGLAALQLQACPNRAGAAGIPASLRSLFRTVGTHEASNTEINLPVGMPKTCEGPGGAPPPLYPAPHLNEYDPTTGSGATRGDYCDYKAGTGVLTARNLPVAAGGWCDGRSENPCPEPLDCTTIVNHVGLDIPSPGQNPIGWTDPQADDYPPDDGSTTEESQRGASNTTRPLRAAREGTPILWRVIDDFGGHSAQEGDRVRATLAFYSCPSKSPEELGPLYADGLQASEQLIVDDALEDLKPAVDYDLVLRGAVKDDAGDLAWNIIYAAESRDESNEGLDVVFEQDYDHIELRIVAPADWSPCNPGGAYSGEPIDLTSVLTHY